MSKQKTGRVKRRCPFKAKEHKYTTKVEYLGANVDQDYNDNPKTLTDKKTKH